MATPPLREDGYRSLLLLATAARSTLSLAATVGLVAGVALTADTFRDDPIVTLAQNQVDLDAVARTVIAAFLVTLVVTGVAFVSWAVQAYRNLPALAIEERRYWTIWLVVGWVIPGANLLVPKLVVDDLWRGSSPDVGIDGGSAWQQRPVASIVNHWWYSFLTTPAVACLGLVSVRGGLDEFDQRVVIGAAAVTSAASIVVAAIAARRMVAVVTVAQARRADVIVDMRDSRRAARDHLFAMERSRS